MKVPPLEKHLGLEHILNLIEQEGVAEMREALASHLCILGLQTRAFPGLSFGAALGQPGA